MDVVFRTVAQENRFFSPANHGWSDGRDSGPGLDRKGQRGVGPGQKAKCPLDSVLVPVRAFAIAALFSAASIVAVAGSRRAVTTAAFTAKTVALRLLRFRCWMLMLLVGHADALSP